MQSTPTHNWLFVWLWSLCVAHPAGIWFWREAFSFTACDYSVHKQKSCVFFTNVSPQMICFIFFTSKTVTKVLFRIFLLCASFTPPMFIPNVLPGHLCSFFSTNFLLLFLIFLFLCFLGVVMDFHLNFLCLLLFSVCCTNIYLCQSSLFYYFCLFFSWFFAFSLLLSLLSIQINPSTVFSSSCCLYLYFAWVVG